MPSDYTSLFIYPFWGHKRTDRRDAGNDGTLISSENSMHGGVVKRFHLDDNARSQQCLRWVLVEVPIMEVIK